MVLNEIGTPIDEQIVVGDASAGGLRRRDEHELFIKKVLDRKARGRRRAIHDGKIECSFDQALVEQS